MISTWTSLRIGWRHLKTGPLLRRRALLALPGRYMPFFWLRDKFYAVSANVWSLFVATELFFLSRQMAEAGFFHSSNDRDPDIARCFVCFKELEGWEPEDNPLYVGALRKYLLVHVYLYIKLSSELRLFKQKNASKVHRLKKKCLALYFASCSLFVSLVFFLMEWNRLDGDIYNQRNDNLLMSCFSFF